MKFPSVKTLALSALNTIKRFPFEILFALAATIASTINIELENINRVGENWCIRVMIIGNLGLLLSLSATLYSESRKLSSNKKTLIRVIAALIAVSFLFLINPGIRQADYVRFFLLSLTLHLLVAFAAFTKAGHIQGFWQFNKTLFLRFLAAALYGIVLFLGLSAAIGAMNYLFNFKFESDTFTILLTWIVGMFSTTFFLAGVPDDFAALDEDSSYPKGLKIFTQYVLIPLATVYVLILLAYEIKILIQWNLPKGAVSYLILSYAVFGILSLLLVYPVREQEENKWLKTYARSFYFLLIPLLILLFVAVGVRLSNYGITEFRYFLIALAGWLLFITGYFLFFKKQNIKIIPISLSIVTFLSVYGPQSAFSVAMYSQRHILIEILKRNNAFKDGKLQRVKKINNKDGNRAIEVLDYLIAHHDLSSLQPYINADLDAVSDSMSKQRDKNNYNFTVENYALRAKKIRWVKHYLGLKNYYGDNGLGRRYYSDDYDEPDTSNNYYFHTRDDITTIKGYDYSIRIKGYNDTTGIIHNGLKITQTIESDKAYTIVINNEKVIFNVNAFAKKLIASKKVYVADLIKKTNIYEPDEYVIPDDSLTIVKETKSFTIAFVIGAIRVSQHQNGDTEAENPEGVFLIRKK